MRRVPRPAVVELGGEERPFGETMAWRACFFAQAAPQPDRGLDRIEYPFAFCQLIQPAKNTLQSAIGQLRIAAAEQGYDRVDWFELDPPMGEAERSMLTDLREKMSHGLTRMNTEANHEIKTENKQTGRAQRTRDYSEAEAPGAIAARIAGGLF